MFFAFPGHNAKSDPSSFGEIMSRELSPFGMQDYFYMMVVLQ